MSELIIDFRGLTPSPEACLRPTPETGVDGCSYTIPLRDEGLATARPVRFDRVRDQFVLSPNNGGDVLTWAGSHANLSTVLTTVRVLHTLTQGTQLGRSAGGTQTLGILAHYITTGEGLDPEMTAEDGRMLIASAMLDILTDSPEQALSALHGRLSVLRSQDWLDAAARERARSIGAMTDLVPQYRSFRQHFLSESEFASWDTAGTERRQQIEAIAAFVRGVVLSNAFDQPLRYSDQYRAAEAAYQARYQAEIAAGTRHDFCSALETALRQLRGERGLPRNFLADCRLASALVDQAPVEGIRETIRRDLLAPAGLRRLQSGIEDESAAANMNVAWLARQGDDSNGGRIGEILALMLPHVRHLPPVAPSDSGREEGDMLNPFDRGDGVSIEAAPFIVEVNTLIDSQGSRRREYLIAALAVMRRFFPEGGFPAVRGFLGGEFRDLNWHLSSEDLGLLQQFRRSLENRLGSSQDQSDVALPIIEAGICAVGAAGLLSSHLIPEVADSPDLQLGLGTASATLAGGGCSALLGHFLWPEITDDIHNRYIWEGLTGLGGALIAGTIYFLVGFLQRDSGPGPDGRFPVDEYGP